MIARPKRAITLCFRANSVRPYNGCVLPLRDMKPTDKSKFEIKKGTIMNARIQILNGIPTTVINGKPIPEMAYITYRTDHNCYEDFARVGVKLYSVNLNFSEMPINERAPVLVFQKGIFEHEAPDFSIVDHNFGQILEACPDAYIFPRVNVNLSEAWEKAHPEELCEKGFGDRCRVSYASDVWAEEVKRELSLLIEYIENSPFADHVIGYQIAGGNTEEWLPLDPQSGYGPRAHEKFMAFCKQKQLTPDEESYYTFASELLASRILEFSEHTKQATNGQKLVGVFYGYTLSSNRAYCHHALGEVLRSDAVDFLCSPVTYQDTRAAGIDPWPMLPVASLRLHSKLYFSENDIRTHLSRPVHDHPNYVKPVWYGHEKTVSTEQLKLSFCRALIYGYAMWWFDMWGGWYHDDDYMALMAKMQDIVKDGMDVPACEVALVMDEASYSACRDGGVLPETARAMGLVGAPYDAYLASDFDEICDRYRAFVFVKVVESDLIHTCIGKANAAGKAVKVITAEDRPVSTESLKAFFKQAGVAPLTEKKAVVYEGARFVSLYTAEDGVYDFEVDGQRRLVDRFTGETITFPAVLPKYRCLLFER